MIEGPRKDLGTKTEMSPRHGKDVDAIRVEAKGVRSPIPAIITSDKRSSQDEKREVHKSDQLPVEGKTEVDIDEEKPNVFCVSRDIPWHYSSTEKTPLQLEPCGPRFSPAILMIIAEHLISAKAFATLASLNAASRAVKESTMPVLYESVLLDHGEDQERVTRWLAGDRARWNATK
jgi:hypothetical protein